MTLRPAGAEDAARLAEFAARAFRETFGPDNRPEDMAEYLATAYGRAQQARELADPSYQTLLLEEDSALVGFAQLRRGETAACVSGPEPVELYRFYVDRAFHGRGFAQSLMEAVHAAAAALGGRTLWLGVWERNARAIRFYEKCGYRVAGNAEFFVGRDRQTDLVMVTAVHG
jgi:ribosomal protein S18 acetylase RimI-like enzyme